MIEVDDMMDDDDKKVYLGFINLIGEEMMDITVMNSYSLTV